MYADSDNAQGYLISAFQCPMLDATNVSTPFRFLILLLSLKYPFMMFFGTMKFTKPIPTPFTSTDQKTLVILNLQGGANWDCSQLVVRISIRSSWLFPLEAFFKRLLLHCWVVRGQLCFCLKFS